MRDQLVPTRYRFTAAKAGGAVLALGVLALGVLALGVLAAAATQAPARAVTQPGGLPVGPVKISPLGHPKLCWMAWGNGSPVTLQSCDTTLQGEEWTFTAGHILMNGNGYCLQNGGSAQPGSPDVDSLYLGFSGQCAGAASQNWTFGGATGTIENPPGHVCATAQGGTVVDGATIVARRCGRAGGMPAWSQGTSDLTLSSARPGAAAGGRAGPRGTGTNRAFTARMAVSNATKAMTAYAASVSVRAPAGLSVTKLTGTGALSGWACQVRALRCQGNLPGDAKGAITVAGTVSSRTMSSQAADAARDAIAAYATVAGTNQVPHAKVTATTPVRIYTPTTAGSTHGTPSGGIVTFGAIAAVLLAALGTVLAFAGRRRRQQPAVTRTDPAPER